MGNIHSLLMLACLKVKKEGRKCGTTFKLLLHLLQLLKSDLSFVMYTVNLHGCQETAWSKSDLARLFVHWIPRKEGKSGQIPSKD